MTAEPVAGRDALAALGAEGAGARPLLHRRADRGVEVVVPGVAVEPPAAGEAEEVEAAGAEEGG